MRLFQDEPFHMRHVDLNIFFTLNMSFFHICSHSDCETSSYLYIRLKKYIYNSIHFVTHMFKRMEEFFPF